jgi:glycosyltransferase involved in cell wall biosynthesis
MEFLKGGQTFLDALPRVAASLEKPLRVTFAGDGCERQAWQRQAAQVQSGQQNLSIEFTGWMNRQEADSLLKGCDLLVVPSVWPEPFGLVGPEAGLRGVPVVAFAVGGISDWLVNDVNGYLAPGDPPTPDGLAEAILRCLSDPARHASLRDGALKMARQFNLKDHLSALREVFEHVTAPRARLTMQTCDAMRC